MRRQGEQLPIDFEGMHDGMQRAVDNANAASPDWSDRALDFVRQYARRHPSFRMEQVRYWAEAQGFPIPPSRRAWGAVAVQAKIAGIIKNDGHEMAEERTAHPTPVTRWRSLVY